MENKIRVFTGIKRKLCSFPINIENEENVLFELGHLLRNTFRASNLQFLECTKH